MEHYIEFATNNIVLVVIWVGLFAALIYSFIAPALSKVKRLDNHEATMLINKQDALVVDIRPEKEFKKGHILDSVQLKAEQVRESNFTSLEKYKERPIIVVCAMGNQASGVANKMLKSNFNQVNVLSGGISAWQGAGLPVSK